MIQWFSTSEQGGSVYEGRIAKEGVQTLYEILAVPTAYSESRMTLLSESTCTEARC